jgi:integrase/recombinase XerD
MLLLETGFSVGQLTALELDDLDLPAGRVNLTFADNQQQWFPLGEAQMYLEHYLHKGRPELIRDSRETALFVSQKDGRLSRQGIWQILNHWGRLADPPILLSPRLIRHMAVQRMLRRGYPLKEIQRLLGHNNPLSTSALLRRLSAARKGMPGSFSNLESDQEADFAA